MHDYSHYIRELRVSADREKIDRLWTELIEARRSGDKSMARYLEECLCEYMLAHHLERHTLASGETISVCAVLGACAPKKGKAEPVRHWLRAHGHRDENLSKIMTERLTCGLPLPPDEIFKVDVKWNCEIR